ncbi:hypothetical protein [Streptomyces sp. NBC_00859]|uniref:hypothetical protein n=1 Tax=Streptomyces sp. NBC_00859 TaxID=2903682 RepID=UPI0038672D41|nr:hypothetical protein OG584_15480 [Streptomyces sp. NBC_00859]
MSGRDRFGGYGRDHEGRDGDGHAPDGRDGADGSGGLNGSDRAGGPREPDARDMPAEWRKQYGGPTRSVNNQAGNGMQTDGSDNAAEDLEEDELALRRMMQGAVSGLDPSDDALDRLRRAVPARRARRRQVVVGTAAAALLVGTAIPAFLHVAGSGDGAKDHPAVAGRGHYTPGGTGASADGDGGKKGKGSSSGDGGTDGGGGKKDKPKGAGSGTHGGPGGGGTDPSGRSLGSLPACGAQQLGVTSADTGTPNADGTVYGTFRVSNVSHSQCAVSDAGTVNFQALGAADAARITVVDHTAGDAAGGLPDPSQETSGLVLAPSQAYEVKFAWVPAETCPTGGGTPDPTPSAGSGGAGGPEGSGGTGDDGPSTSDGTSGSDATPQLGSGDGASDGSVAVVHEAEPGVPAAEATIPNACAGTIYRTGLLTAP